LLPKTLHFNLPKLLHSQFPLTKCNNGKNHSYLAYVQQRLRGSGCAVCAGRQIIPETSLATLFPDIAKEWDYEKNSPLTPLDVGKGYDGDIWWKCLDNPEHTHPLSGIKSRIQKEGIFSLNPDLCQISTKRSNNM
jgi:hypothetical protein